MKNDSNIIGFLNKITKGMTPLDILRKSIQVNFKDNIVYVCSFGTESAIILHMISKIEKNFPIILLNTNFLFEETIHYKNYLLKKLNLKNLKEVFPDPRDLDLHDKNNILWKSNPDSCCNIRKVKPLQKELKKYKAWISGRKAFHLGDRKDLRVFESLNDRIVINPLASIDKTFVNTYFEKNKINRHPLFEQGYLSIGCINCTEKSIDSSNPRSGRWSNKTKTECGIHYNKKE